jgi:putative hydrolase of the HAD superfamily
VLLFDLGGVLVELTGVPTMLAWLGNAMTVDELWRRWLSSPAVRRFEIGRSSLAEFGAALVAEFGLPVAPHEFIDAFARWPRGLYDGVIPLLESLHGSYRLACFSNTNELHWSRLREEMGLGRYLDASFPSHLIGCLKPDRDAFDYVVNKLLCTPDRILFLDDNIVNVEAARAAGMQAHRAQGFPAVVQILGHLGVI